MSDENSDDRLVKGVTYVPFLEEAIRLAGAANPDTGTKPELYEAYAQAMGIPLSKNVVSNKRMVDRSILDDPDLERAFREGVLDKWSNPDYVNAGPTGFMAMGPGVDLFKQMIRKLKG